MTTPEVTAGPAQADDAVQALRTIAAHRDLVRLGLLALSQDLERRSLAHDLSKLSPDEFAGFSRINRIAREHPFGSDEYRASMRLESETIRLHYSRNSHHPEHHPSPKEMGFLDIVEMVCDWRAAYLVYGSQGTWTENIQRQAERYGPSFTAAQWWLVEQVAEWVAEQVP